MRTWLKRMVAGIVSAGTLMGSGLLMAGTANADEIRMPDIGKTITSLTASAATTYPRELVNGDFEYPSMKSLQHYFTGIDRNRSQWISNGQGDDLAKWSDIPGGLDTTRFGWSSTQTQGAMSEQRANAVELQKATGETTQMGELCASQKGTAIYQDIATTPGTLYRIELDHASRYSIHLDQMQVMVGAPGHERPVEMTRTSSNKYGDKIGEKSTTIATHSTNPFGNQSSKDDFSHYVGYYTIPAGQSVTRFTFRQVSGVNTTSGNLLDNIVFTQAYKLDYDRNSDEATGQTPNDTATVKPAKTSATGGVKTVADENVRYGSLANGDFSYPSFSDIQENEQGTYADLRTFLKSDDGTLWYNMSTTDLSKYGKIGQIPGFDSSRFAWSSTENGSRVELQQDRNTKNTYAEIVAQQDNTSIYQNVSTGNGGVLYKIRLKHASRQSSHADKMQVLVGSDTAHATPVEMTRVTSNGHGDKVGGKSTTITTKVSNTDPRDHGSQWETYEGYYQMPEGQKNTVFMFKSLEGFKDVETLPGNNVGNLVDDIEFSRSYKLTYDKNASDATGKVPSNQRGKENAVEPAESKTTGNVKTVADNTSNLPDHLVNGTFDYRGNEIINENQRVYGDTTNLAIINAKTGVIGNPLHSKLDNWDSGKFGWRSNDATAGGDTVEVQRRNHTPYPTNAGNVWGEIAAAKQGKYIYQDIDTANTSDAMYTVRLKHASRNKDARDSMQVLVGAPGREKPVTMRRTIANAGDKAGEESTTITSTGTGQDDQWDTYEGTVLVPRGQDVTRFTFKSVADSNSAGRPDSAEGNLIDDVVFTKAYQLTYDANGGVKTRTSQIDYTTGGGTRGKVKTVRDSPAPPAGQEKIVNGDFEYSGTGAGLSDSPFNYVSLSRKSYYYKDSRNVNHRVALPAGFDAKRFAWKSDQTGKDLGNPPYEQAGDVQVWNRYDGSNHYAELTAAQAGSAIYQDIDTESDSDVQYIVSLRHASLNASHLDSMQVLIGAPGHETPVTMTRVTANGYGDKVGESSDTIATRVSNPKPADREDSDHTGQWETYTGTVTVPAGRPVTRFTFRNVSSKSAWNGNLIDDVVFTKAYQLTYDANGGTKAQASQIGYRTDATQGAVETVASKTLPTELVNGSFDYLLDGGWDTISPVGRGGYADDRGWGRFTSVDPASGEYIQNAGQNPATFDSTGKWVKWPGFDAAKFGWASDQKGGQPQGGVGLTDRPNAVELQQDSVTGNTYAEIVGSERGKAILQKIDTQHDSDTVYTVRFDHASLSKEHADSMQVLVNGKPVTMTRVTSNKAGDEQGWTGTSITTHATNTNRFQHDGQWATYEGKVTIPANTPVSTFTFKALNAVDPTKGNLIDNLTFKIAYRLSYDANGGAKTNASKISASSNGTVRLAATRTSVPSHALEDTDVPADYRSFTFDTTRTRLADARFDGNWTTTRDEAGGSIHWPTRLGASATLPNTGTWTDPDGVEHRINATIALKQWNGGNIGQLNRFDGNGKIVGDGLFWINVVYDNTKVPASVRKALGGIDTSKRVGCQWTVSFTYEDGTPVPSTFKGVTGFNDLDGFDARPDLKFEGVQLLSGFDGAYRTRDAELASYGTNGYAGIKHDAGDESNLNGAQQVRHRLAATWTGPTFTYSYDLENPTERTDGVRMTFGMPVTRTQVLTYKANGGTGQVPSRTEAGKTETAASRMNGTVRLAADRDTEPESGTTTDDRKVLTDTIARQDDGTSQRTITRSDGSVQVQTIADTGAVSGCQVYYPAGAKITLATAKADSDCWDSSQISKTNRTFYGWSANTDANDKDVPVADTMDRAALDANAETQITMPARAKTVYALWAINPTLTYNVNAPATTKAPDAPASITVPYNTAADDKSGWTVGDTGKITGYSFDGWYTSPTGGDKYDWSTKLTNDVTMYAHWTANGYTVKYDAGGGKGTMGDQKFTFDVPQNLSPNAFTRDGYTFTGWKRADTGDAYQDGQQVANLTSTPNGIVTMIAQWTPNPASINYDPNPPTGRTPGGQGTANWTGHTGDTQAIGANGWTVDGYTFIGWNTSADGKGTAYAPGTTWIANGTLTLYAQWTPGEASLSYDGNGATGGKTDPQTGKTDEKINVRDNGFTRDGYTFVTWNTQADCKGNAVKPNSEWTLRGSSTLYACWAGNAQTLTYHGNGATGGNTAAQSGKTGDELTTNANGFTRDGYTFVRWDTAKDGSGTAYGEGKNGVSQYVMKPAGNDLYAIWKANPATIQYRNDWPNTTGSTPDTTGNTGDTVTISQNSFDRPGYTFTGWSTSKRGDPSLQPGDKHTLEPRTTTVWAQWKADPAHLVYNSNIGTVGSETKTVDGVVDQTVKTITNPFDRPGYTFSGWNTQADGKGKAYATGADYVLTANDKSTPKNTSVLYAQWKINGASLKFNPNGGIGHVDDVTGDAFSTVTIPGDAKEPKITRPGYRFVGWSTEKNPPAGSTFLQPGEGKVTLPAEGSTTVYAQWEPSLTTLPFTGGQAQVPTIWLYAGFALMLIALGVMMPMLRTRMAATKRTGKHMPITGGKHAK